MVLLRPGPCGSLRQGDRLPHRGETERQPKGEDAGGTPALPGGVLPFVDNLFDFGCHPPIKNSSSVYWCSFVSIRGSPFSFVEIFSSFPTFGGTFLSLLQPLGGPSSFFVALRGLLFFYRIVNDFPRTPWSRSPPTADPSGPVPGWEFARSNAPAPRPPAGSETARRPPDTTPG